VVVKPKVFKGTFREEEMVEKKETKADEKKAAGKPSWVKMKVADLEKIVVELGKEGHSPAQIGLILRDKHGVPKAKLLGKKITQILKEHGVEFIDDEKVVNDKIAHLKGHIEKNRHDYPASRALTKRLWDIYHIKQKKKA
jgi:ribosomal protein S15P/S13E